MKVGDLVRAGNPDSAPGLVLKIDKDFYGAEQAFKIFKNIERGHAIRSNIVDGIGPTKDGIRDRVLVLWPEEEYSFSYEESNVLEVINENR